MISVQQVVIIGSHTVENPGEESEMMLLRQYAPDVPEEMLKRLTSLFHDLRELVDKGLLGYPYSLRYEDLDRSTKMTPDHEHLDRSGDNSCWFIGFHWLNDIIRLWQEYLTAIYRSSR